MSEEKKYPKVIVGAFIFNDKDELFLTKGVKWHNKYVCPGGRVEVGEKIEETLRREIKEETNLDIEIIKFIGVADGFDVNDKYIKEDNHLIFLDYKVKAKNAKKIKLNEEAFSYKWLELSEWLKKDINEFAPYTYEVLQKLNLVKDNYENMYKRALADYQNLIKETAREKIEFAKYANRELLHEVIPIYDNLKLSLKHTDEIATKNGWVQGVHYIVKQFRDVLKSAGVEEIKTKGEKFNPETMEAIEGKGDKVRKEVKPGYKLHGKVIVPAKVIVE
ncbi:MAG: nucleotide exchange factor GrpE [Patescibacteria group bacterium]